MLALGKASFIFSNRFVAFSSHSAFTVGSGAQRDGMWLHSGHRRGLDVDVLGVDLAPWLFEI